MGTVASSPSATHVAQQAAGNVHVAVNRPMRAAQRVDSLPVPCLVLAVRNQQLTGGRAIGTHRSGGTRMDGFSRVCTLPKDFMPLTPTRCQPLMAKKWRDSHSSPVSCGDRQPGQTARIFRWEIEAQRAETELRGPLGALTGAQSHDITIEPLGLY